MIVFFAKFAKSGEIPSATLYEDEDFRVILDLGPASKGHALILPKAHAANTSEHRSMYSYVRLSIDRCTATYV